MARLPDWEGVPMKKNILVGIGILSLAFVGPQSPWAYLGVVPLLTGLVGWCPPYALLGIGTTARNPKEG